MILVVLSDCDNITDRLNRFFKMEPIDIKGIDLCITKLNNYNILFTNIDSTKVAIAKTLITINNFYPIDLMIGVGNCASISNVRKQIGKVAIVSDTLQYDVDFSAMKYPYAMLPDINKRLFLCNSKLAEVAKEACHNVETNYVVGRMVSADRFCANGDTINRLRSKFAADFVDCETAVLSEVGSFYDVPTIIVKGISNYGDINAFNTYLENKLEANTEAFRVVYDMLQIITKKGY